MRFVPWRVLVIVAAGALLGLAWNTFSGRGFALASNVLLKPGDEVIGTAEARARFDRGALFLDARPRDFYLMEHVAGARALPEDDFERAFAELEDVLRTRFDIVVYCSGFGCEASHTVAGKLRERGIQAAVFTDGWPAWTEAGHPRTQGANP